MSLPQRLSDKEYRNWVVCGTSLITLKEGLHDYIDIGVKKLHEDITKNVCTFLSGSGALATCTTCSSKDIFRTRTTARNPSRWTINCLSNVCNVWLDEIIASHNEPQSKSINWRNSDITKWPTDPYEIAKIFMPKGQDKKKNLPKEFDIPAVLSILKYCKYFSSCVPNLQLLTDLIDMRNTLYHSGDFRVCDTDRNIWIDKMVQLVADLNIQGSIYSDLNKVKTEDIDIDFRQTEIRVLQNMVSSFSSDLENVYATVSILKSTQANLLSETQKLSHDSRGTQRKTHALEFQAKKVKKQVHELTKNSDKITSFFENNPDIVNENLTERLRSMEKDVNQLRCKQCEIQSDIEMIKEVLSSIMKRNAEETNNDIQCMETKTERSEKQLEAMQKTVNDELQQNVEKVLSIGENFVDQRIYYHDSQKDVHFWDYWYLVACIFGIFSGIIALLNGDSRLDPLLEVITVNYTTFCSMQPIAIIVVIDGLFGIVTLIYSCSSIHKKRTSKSCCVLFMRIAHLLVVIAVCWKAFAPTSTISQTESEGKRLVEKITRDRYESNFSTNDRLASALDYAQDQFNCCWKRKFQGITESDWTKRANATVVIHASCCLTTHYEKDSENQTQGELILPKCPPNSSWSNEDMGCLHKVMQSMTQSQGIIFIVSSLSAIVFFISCCTFHKHMTTEKNLQFQKGK